MGEYAGNSHPIGSLYQRQGAVLRLWGNVDRSRSYHCGPAQYDHYHHYRHCNGKGYGIQRYDFRNRADGCQCDGIPVPGHCALVGSIGTFITGSGTSSNVLFGNLQTDAAVAINADEGWLAAANAAGTCAGKMISPQSIAIAVGAISLKGKDNEILQAIVKVYIPYILILGIVVYFGQALIP